MPIIEQLDGWEQKAMEIVVTNISQKDLMKKAREGRLIVKNVRVSADKLRKELNAYQENFQFIRPSHTSIPKL